MADPQRVLQPTSFTQVDAVTHEGVVIAFGEEWDPDDRAQRRLWYRVLDLEQTADADAATAWEDATRWTRWYEMPWPTEVRAIGMSLFDVDLVADHSFAPVAGRWKAIDDGAHVYLFRALDLSVGEVDGATRVYASRYRLMRLPSPDGGDNRGASGREITVPQLVPAREARYRRSGLRETPSGDTDSQGTRDIGNLPFFEPTMEWSMLRPVDGAFAVTLTPSSLPGRSRWQFFCRAEREFDGGGTEPAIAAYSFLRDDDGWADLAEKSDQLNDDLDDRFRVRADRVFSLTHPERGVLAMAGRPAATTFRLQEQSSPLHRSEGRQQEERALSGQRVLLALRVADDAGDGGRLLAADFGLDPSGAVEVGETLEVPTVDFARSALWLNSAADRVTLTGAGGQQGATFSVQAWVRHDQGTGSLVARGWAPGDDVGGWDDAAATAAGAPATGPAGWAVEWLADRRVLAGIRVTGGKAYRVEAPLPTSFTWHHVGLVHDDAGLALFVDGVEAQRLAIAAAGDGAVAGDLVVGGPAPSPGWLDFRIDQVVLRQSPAVPSLDTIYVELDAAARADADVLGYWTFDRVAGAAAADHTLAGTDYVTQSAPLFPPDKAAFEQHLAGMSPAMGLLDVPGWTITADPHLFVGADGIARVYTVADGDEGKATAGELVYDTTTTRTQFAARWQAIAPQSERAGILVLQAREPGPVMNRAAVEFAETGDTLTLRITHPQRGAAFGEEWRNLPRHAADIAAILNGRARPRLPDEAPPAPAGDDDERPPPAYAYCGDGPRECAPDCSDCKVAYPSALLQAIVPALPDNGAEPLVAAGPAGLRQQGNYTGWTHAPLAVSGRFGDDVAAADITADPFRRLRIPGDFAVEAWVNPAAVAERERIVNWLQGDDDGFSLATRSTGQFALSPDTQPGIELNTSNRTWFGPGGEFMMSARFEVPDGGGGGRVAAIAQLVTSGSVSIDADAFYGRLRALRQERIDAMPEADRQAAQDSLDAWAPPTGAVAVTRSTRFLLGVRGKAVEFTSETSLEAADAADAPTVTAWRTYLDGGSVQPPGARWSVAEETLTPVEDGTTLINVPIFRDAGEPADVVVAVDATAATDARYASPLRTGPRPRVTCTIDGQLASVNAPPADDPPLWFAPPSGRASGRVAVGQAPGTSEPPFAGTIHSITTARGAGGAVTFTQAFEGPSDKVPADLFTGALFMETTLGDRRYETVRPITPADWLHLGVVCSNNFAVRCDGEGDRAVIADSSGLTPDKEFTIDCVVVREAGGSGAVFSRAVELGEDRAVSWRLSIDADGRAHLKYTVSVEGETQVHDEWSACRLDVGKPYQLIASVKLEDVFHPAKPKTDGDPGVRWQFWLAHAAVWVYDIEAAAWCGPPPYDLAAAPTDLASILLAEQRAQLVKILKGLAVFHPVYLSGAGFPDVRYTVLGRTRDTDPFYNIKIKSVDAPAAIGAATGEDPKRVGDNRMEWFAGLVGTVRMWTTSLPKGAIARLPLEAGLPSGVDPPTAWWRLDENRGLHAEDSAGGMVATLTREEMWVTTRATARLTLYVNGRALPLRPIGGGSGSSYGDPDRFAVGGMVRGGKPAEGFTGLIDDVRVWRDIRTGEEMLDAMHALLGGNEDDLAAWWPLSAGIGDMVKDASAAGSNHLRLVAAAGAADFWAREAAPIGEDLPQVRHLLGGQATSWTMTGIGAAPMAAEYGDIQTDAEGRLAGVQKRAMVVARDVGADISTAAEQGWVTPTGFKTGDLDLIYVGQAQSDPTMIGYIEGAPPVPSENLTRPYYNSAWSYVAYNDNSVITLREAENTTTLYTASYDRGFDMAIAGELLFVLEGKVDIGSGVAFGGFFQSKVSAANLNVNFGPKLTFDLGLGWQQSYAMSVGTNLRRRNQFGLAGTWEDPSKLLDPAVGRRFVPDNTGYALVVSGVANVYAMRLRRNGAMLGLTMVPDPDIPEDFNIITFRIRPDYTKQGTLDGRVGLVTDPDWRAARPGRGSYSRPLEAANLEAQIEAYEAKLLAAYDQFDAGSYGRRSAGTHFQEHDPAQDPRNVVEGRNVVPYDWELGVSRRNLVNTYVWTANGGFFAEEVGTSIVRTESSGGSYSFKGMAGVKVTGKAALGFGVLSGLTWDVSALFGGHIQTTVLKSKTEGRTFDLDVSVAGDALLEKYTGGANGLYSGAPEPGKVSSYRFKSFYLVPDKVHFEEFWDRVVDEDWLESDDLDATALRQARGNLNHVWRVLHRVTYVQRIPPTGNAVPPPPPPPTQTVVHQIPNWQVIKLAVDVLRTGQTSNGDTIGGLTIDQQLAAAADDIVRRQWPVITPWWQPFVAAFEVDPESEAGEVVADLRQWTYEYLKAYKDTGLLARDPRLKAPEPELPEPEPELPPVPSLADGAADASHLYTFDETNLSIDLNGLDYVEFDPPTRIEHADLPAGIQGRLLLPVATAAYGQGTATIAMSDDWGRTGDRTWELCFRLTEPGPVVVLAARADVPEMQWPFRWLAVTDAARGGMLALQPVGADEPAPLEGVGPDTVEKLVYVAIGYRAPKAGAPPDDPKAEPSMEVAWAVEGTRGVSRLSLPAEAGELSGGKVELGGTGLDLFGEYLATGGLEILHLAVHGEVMSKAKVNRQVKAIGLRP